MRIQALDGNWTAGTQPESRLSLIVGIIMCDEHFDIVSIIGSDEAEAMINVIRPE